MTRALAHKRPMDTLAHRLLLVRTEAGLSQRELAARTGVPYGIVQGMEAGRETRNRDVQVGKIALALGYDREWLMWGGALADPDGPEGSPSTENMPSQVYNFAGERAKRRTVAPTGPYLSPDRIAS